jgi:hypothetical protein
MARRFACCPLFFILVGLSPAWAQENFEEVFKNPYVVALQDIMNTWDDGELIIEKDEVADDFFSAVQRRSDDPVYDFEADTNYIDVMQERWETLPESLAPELSFSSGARLVMIGSVFDRHAEISEEVEDPTEFLEHFKMAIYTVFSASQLEAKDAEIGAIDARSVLYAYDAFWSRPWPICCWRSAR